MNVIVSLICPVILLITGYLLKSFPPKNINSAAGYRTSSAKKNPEVWKEANSYSIRLLVNYSWIVLIVSLAASVILGKAHIVIEVFISLMLVIISIIAVVVSTEKHLNSSLNK